MSFWSHLADTALSTAAAKIELDGGSETLVKTLKAAGFSSNVISAQFAEENPALCAAGILVGVATVGLLGPEIMLAGAIAFAEWAPMRFLAGIIGEEAVAVASTVIVDGVVSNGAEGQFRLLIDRLNEVIGPLGGAISSSTGGSDGTISIAPESTVDELWQRTQIIAGHCAQNFSDGTSEATITNSDGSIKTFLFSGSDGTGSILSSSIYNPDGSSQTTTENPEGTSTITQYDSKGYATTTVYSGPNGTGNIISISGKNPDGSSNKPLKIHAPISFGENLPSNSVVHLSGVSVSDEDALDAHEIITLRITAPYALNVTPVNGGVVTGGNSTSLTLVGNIDAVNAELASLTIHTPRGRFHFQTIFEGSDGRGGDLQVACFAQGTLISTPLGDLAVERLAAGDLIHLLSSEVASITWIGHRVMDCRRQPNPKDVWPVRIHANAFGEGKPRHDLWLSPDHSVFVDDVLIPIRYLLNGASIAQEPCDEVTYWHIELEQHGVILAEGLPCESYLDTGNRGTFDNGGRTVHLHPDFALKVWDAQACAPLVRGGAGLERARRRILDCLPQLGWAFTDDPEACFTTEAGKVLEPQIFGEWACLAMPDGAARLQIESRQAAPAELNPASDDFRRLGVPVTHLHLDGEMVGLDDSRFLSGWHATESGLRWSNGRGVLDVAGVSIVELRLIRGLVRYAAQMKPSLRQINEAA